MEEPLTEDMLAELLDAPDPRAFIKRREVGERSLAEYLDALLLEKGLKRSVVVREAGINERRQRAVLQESARCHCHLRHQPWLYAAED